MVGSGLLVNRLRMAVLVKMVHYFGRVRISNAARRYDLKYIETRAPHPLVRAGGTFGTLSLKRSYARARGRYWTDELETNDSDLPSA